LLFISLLLTNFYPIINVPSAFSRKEKHPLLQKVSQLVARIPFRNKDVLTLLEKSWQGVGDCKGDKGAAIETKPLAPLQKKTLV
jgi:hypothetical protein